MADFTEAERAYITLFTRLQATLPDAYCSVKNLTIVDRKSLLKSLLLFISSRYYNASNVYFGDFILEKSMINKYYKLNGNQVALDLENKTQSEIYREGSDIIKKIMRYLPGLPLTIPRDTSFLQDPDVVEQTAEFMRHLEINRSLLLQGPPHANDHTIDPDKASKWVEAQLTPERRRLAQILLDNIRYIPHKQILHALQHCVYKLKKQLEQENRLENPIILIAGRAYKSNYYISLLFAHFWLEAGMRIDCVYEKYYHRSVYEVGTILDVDDMAYSGNQTRNELVLVSKMLFNSLRDYMKKGLENNNDFEATYMFIPHIVMESLLNSMGFRYFLIRAFMSEAGFKEITKQTGISPCLPLQIITYKIIPYLPGVSEEDKRKLEALFNKTAATTVYLDHKVADYPSTFLLPITFGVVPSRPLIFNIKNMPLNDPRGRLNNLQDDEVSFLPFIRHCGPTERKMPMNRKSMLTDEVRDEIRCPYAWYKMIDYDTGTYPKVPLPYGPTETNFAGGKRSRPNRKTKKQKRRVKQKTRSHSK